MAIKNSSVAIYRQIVEYFEYEIASGRLKPNDRIDSIRSLAMYFKVNPNTVQKALNELERSGYIFTDRTNGKFVVDDAEMIKKLRHTLGNSMVCEFVENSKLMGLEFEDIVSMLGEAWKHE